MSKIWNFLRMHSLAAFVVGLVIGGAAGAGAGGGPGTDGRSVAAPTVVRTVTVPGPSVTVTAEPAVAPAPPPHPEPAAPSKYTSFYKFSGSTSKKSPLFTVPAQAAEWQICWSYKGDSNFSVYLLDESGDELELLVNEIGSTSDCTEMVEPVGERYRFNVFFGSGSWTLNAKWRG